MAWAYGGDWSGRRGDELIPILVSLCNAIGDRFEACARPRPNWPVVGGNKSATLVDADFDGLNLLGPVNAVSGGWWALMESLLYTLLGTDSMTGGMYLYGFSKTATYTGDPADNVWTDETLADDIGLGDFGDRAVGVETIFDERSAVRLREALDRMIYVVIRPHTTVEEWFGDTSGSYPMVAFSSESADDAWAEVFPPGALNQSIGAGTLPKFPYVTARVFNSGFNSLASIVDLYQVTVQSTETRTGAEILGTVTDQWVGASWEATSFEGGSVDVQGESVAIPSTAAGDTDSGTEDLESTDFVALTGDPLLTCAWEESIGTDSPFNSDYSDAGWLGNQGEVELLVTDWRQIVDISAYLSDQV